MGKYFGGYGFFIGKNIVDTLPTGGETIEDCVDRLGKSAGSRVSPPEYKKHLSPRAMPGEEEVDIKQTLGET